MSYQLMAAAAIAAIYLFLRFLDATDTPKIKNLPEIPGIPIFGNLIQLALTMRAWLRNGQLSMGLSFRHALEIE